MIDITGYEGLYAVTENGKVWSYRKNIFLKPFLARGYFKVRLYKDESNKQFLIHRLVAEAFLPNSQNLPQINHKDENKLNNCADNLEWCDAKYNINYGKHNEKVSKSHCKKVYCIELDKVFDSANQAAKQLNLFDSNIAKCCKGRYKKTGGYHWRYADTLVKEMTGETKTEKCDCFCEEQRIKGWLDGNTPITEPITVCNGTRERDECTCGGDKSKCDFYAKDYSYGY